MTARPAARDHRAAPPLTDLARPAGAWHGTGPGARRGRRAGPIAALGVVPAGEPQVPPASPCRAMLMRMPAAAMVMTSDDPPNEMNGNGIPVTGSTPTTAPDVDQCLAATQATSPSASRAPKRSGDCVGRPDAEPQECPQEGQHEEGAAMPSSSPITEKMKSVCALGRKPHCACPPPRPAP